MIEQQKLLRLLKLINILTSLKKRTITELAERVETSVPTLYRYIDLLKEVGFNIQSNDLHQYYLTNTKSPADTLLRLDLEEARLLQSLVRGYNSPLQQSLLNKIYAGSELAESAYNLDKAKIGLCHRQLQQAISTKKQVKLIQYFSENSGEIRDRKVEPVRLLDEEMTLEGFDIEKKEIRHFMLTRMEGVKILKNSFKFSNLHLHEHPDPFGVAGLKKIKTKLKLSQIGHRRILEEFPACAAFVSPNGKGHYFEAEVNTDFKLLDRFLLSYCDEVQVMEPEALREHLEKNRTADAVE